MSKVRALTLQQAIKNDAKDVAKFCRATLKANDITQAEVAEYLGITQPSVNAQLKKDSKHVSLELFIAVVKLCDVDGDQIRRVIK